MARGQRQGVGSMMVWMILFVALWLTSTVVLVILYTGQEELRTENARFAQANERLISRSEQSSLALFQQAKPGGPTVVGLLEGERARTAASATGVESDDAAAVSAKLEGVLGTIQSDAIVPDSRQFAGISFLEALTKLYEVYGVEHAVRSKAEERIAQLEGEVEELLQANGQQKSGFEKRAKEIGDQLADVEADRAEYRRERSTQVAQIEQSAEELRKQHDADLTEERQRTAQLEERVEQLQDRTAALHEKFAPLMIGPEPLAIARRPDGHILMAKPGDDVVYINLGRDDRLVLGLVFAVYASTGESGPARIPPDGRAKAQIRVVSINEQSADCEITRLAPNQVILEGDLIANPVYERDRSVGFLVAGEFDLDHDGVLDADGVETIESLIEQWGGSLSSELTALTDFVVLGRAPRRPRAVTDTASSAQVERNRRMQEAFDRYMTTVSTAKTLAVTVLTQEVFLSFLGYASG